MIGILAGLALATNVGVAEREWRLSAYVPRLVPRGTVRFFAHNFGEDPSRPPGPRPEGLRLGGPERRSRPAPTARSATKLTRAGRYTLVCTLPGHEAKGVRATIRVR